MPTEKLLTSKDLADALGVSESSLRRWTNSGAIKTAKTAGGHRRIPLSEAIRFIRETNAPVAQPQILGLPHRQAADDDADRLYRTLESGDEVGAKGQILSMYVAGMTIAEISDGPIRSAMHRLGELWKHSPQGILVEHRATDICIQATGHLRQLIGGGQGSLVAVGGAPEGDSHALPSMLAAAVLTEAGHRAVNFGAETPVELLATAAQDQKVDLVWLSVCYAEHPSRLKDQIERVADRLGELGTEFIVGGRIVDDLALEPRGTMRILRTMAELAAAAKRQIQGN